MKKCLISGLMVLLIPLIGCTSYPRYRTGGPEKPLQVVTADNVLTTNDCLRLGLILQSYLGKPYSGASLFIRGVDCSLFAREAIKKFNNTQLPRTVSKQYQTGRSVAFQRLRFGDLVFFKTERNRVSHIGIFVGHGRFIHASTSRGVIISDMSDKYWVPKYAGARRVLP